MIGLIKGKIFDIEENQIVVITYSGVGYRINTPSTSVFLIDQEVVLFIHTHVRENEISLWGFVSKNELLIFEELISVSGVGAKTALVLIENKGVEGIIRAIKESNAPELKVTGVGLKTAQKLIIELNNKLAKFEDIYLDKINTDNRHNDNVTPFVEEAMLALTSLGYKEQDINIAVKKMKEEDKINLKNSQDLIKFLLKNI